MDARTYLEQIRRQRWTVEGLKLDLEELQHKRDMLGSVQYKEGSGKGGATDDGAADLISALDAAYDAFVREFGRWEALYEQGGDMMRRAREVLTDGQRHAIDLDHVEIVHRYYMLGHDRARIARDMGYATPTVDRYKAEALDWLDYSRDMDGYPMVPVVSE